MTRSEQSLPVKRTPGSACKRGFTLTELLVVIAIIAVLVAILLPALGKANDSARRIKCASNIRNLLQWTICYAAQYRGWVPPLNSTSSDWPYYFNSDTHGADWRNVMLRDLGDNEDLFYCPCNPEWEIPTHWNFPDGTLSDDISVWGYCYFGRPENLAFTWVLPPNSSSPTYSASQPVTADKLTDTPYYDVLWTDITRSVDGNFSDGEGSNHVLGVEPTPANIPLGTGGTNVGHMDGHVEWIPQNEMVRRWYIIDNTNTTYRGYW